MNNILHNNNRLLSVAPMLDWTDRYCRYFLRLISRHTLLYTEMITTGALLNRDPARFLDYFTEEHPVALQLGGSDPDQLARCARIGSDWGYDEINLNVGCPSDRVQSGKFGACLMLEPELVADCVSAMTAASKVPVTVKHRIGVDEQDSYDALCNFVQTIHRAGCHTFIVHARKAWLAGLSPKENREIPPLSYDTVHRLKKDFPNLSIVINGGLINLDQVEHELQLVDGAMIGREAYHNPWILSQADQRIFHRDVHPVSRHQVARAMLPLLRQECSRGVPLNRITRHMLGLFHGQPGAKYWRRHLSEHAHLPGAAAETVEQALQLVPETALC